MLCIISILNLLLFKAKLPHFSLIILYVSGPPSHKGRELRALMLVMELSYSRILKRGWRWVTRCLQATDCGLLEGVGGTNSRRFIFRTLGKLFQLLISTSPISRPVVLELTSESPGGEQRWLVSPPRASDSLGLNWALRIRISDKLTDAIGLGTHLENHCPRKCNQAKMWHQMRKEGSTLAVSYHRSGLWLQ